jgi:hypothetical protein
MGYTPAGGENAPAYIITFEDEDGKKHDIVVDSLPATVADKDGDVYKITKDEDGSVHTEKIEEILASENLQDRNNSNIDVEKTKEKVRTLVDSLIVNIKNKLYDSNDQIFQLAYKNTDDLNKITTFDVNIGSGGQHINKNIFIGRAGVVEGVNTDGSDGDIMATIFHEYIHYVCFISSMFPKRYQYSIEEGIVYSEKIPIGEELEDEATFRYRVYLLFLMEKYNIDYEKYSTYPDDYGNLNENQRKELDGYIKKNKLSPTKTIIYDLYIPSNHIKDELNAHSKTLEAVSLELFTFSQKKIIFYNNELKRYQNMYNKSLDIERKYNYAPDGYKK